MSQFANEFTIDEIRLQPATQIPLYTLILIMNKSCTHEEMLWYINQTHKNGWSRSMVLNQFKLKAYEHSHFKYKFINELPEYLERKLKEIK